MNDAHCSYDFPCDTENGAYLMSEQHNPLLMLVGQTEDMRRGFYNDLALRVEVDDEDVRICGVIGSQDVAPTSTSGTRR